MCVCEKKKEPLEGSHCFPELGGLCVFQFTQDILVLCAGSKDKASLFHLKRSQL